ncbi:MAG: hypothetical protein P1V81_02640 [Planctomycetota bacterium]|nr:hypothetical protein [Planctomycetota bacterium]
MHPDLRGVLEDIAAQPEQRLFAGTYFRRMHEAFLGEDATVGIAQSGLSSAERHLVAMHRRELSSVLLEAFYSNFFSPGGPSGLLQPVEQPMSRSDWEETARFARDTSPSDAFADGVGPWLHRLLDGKAPIGMAGYSGMLAASLRLASSSYAQLYSGIVYGRYDADRAALGTWASLVRRSPAVVKLSALRYSRDVHAGRGDLLAARACQDRLVGAALRSGDPGLIAEELVSGALLQRIHRLPHLSLLPQVPSNEVHEACYTRLRDLLPMVLEHHAGDVSLCEELDGLVDSDISWSSS